MLSVMSRRAHGAHELVVEVVVVVAATVNAVFLATRVELRLAPL